MNKYHKRDKQNIFKKKMRPCLRPHVLGEKIVGAGAPMQRESEARQTMGKKKKVKESVQKLMAEID